MFYGLKDENNLIVFKRGTAYVLGKADWGAAEAEHATSKGFRQIGRHVAYSTLETRDISITGHIRATSAEDMDAKKRALARMCDPLKTFYALPKPDIQIECRALNTVRFAAERLLNNDYVAQFTIDAVAYDPLFRDAEEKKRSISEWKSNFTFPLVIPQAGFTFSDYTESRITSLINNGDSEIGMIIEFTATGAVENPSLTNLNTGEFIKLNRTMQAGEVITVDTRYGHEGVTSNIGGTVTDIINDLDIDSSFMQAPPGTTPFKYEADENVTSMTVAVRYRQGYMVV